ncbi:hypothetical protein [Polycladidibacter stylochi]|uniref:hypothetical protein n=1 Tax=Polycladidibacter stylochi TaxID=1807766 RepID=UPI001AD8F85A|nr:hypothetical protein [Pseudovibrio stylochi]
MNWSNAKVAWSGAILGGIDWFSIVPLKVAVGSLLSAHEAKKMAVRQRKKKWRVF